MRLVELQVSHLPGVDAPFRVSELSPCVTVVVGPNASGKSSMVRALRALWSAEVHAGDAVDVRAEFRRSEPGGQEATYRATRVGSTITWERNGLKVDPPPTPPEHLLNSYLISIETLMRSGRTDATIGDLLRREMTGGYDLQEARAALVKGVKGHRGASNEFRKARRKLEALERERQLLNERSSKRGELLQQRAQASALAQEVHQYELAMKLREHLADLERENAKLASMPAELAQLTGQEGEDLAGLLGERSKAADRRERAQRDLEDARVALRDTGLATADLDHAVASSLQAAAAELHELHEKVANNETLMAERLAERSGPWRRLGGARAGPTQAAFDALSLEAAEKALGERMAAGAHLEALSSELRQLQNGLTEAEDVPADDDALLSEEDLGSAQTYLASWLAAPLHLTSRPRSQVGPLLLLLLAALLFLVTTVLALRVSGVEGLLQQALGLGPAFYLPAGGGVVAALVGLVWWLTSRGRPGAGDQAENGAADSAAAHARHAYLDTGAREPAEWRHAAVAARLRELLTVASARRAAGKRRAGLESRLSSVSRQVEDARGRVRVADERLVALARATGYSWSGPDGLSAGFAAWLRDVRQVHDLTAKLQALHAQRRKLEERADELYEELRSGLAGTPFELKGPVTAPASWHEGQWRHSKVTAATELRTLTDRVVKAVAARDRARADALLAEKELREAERAENAAAEKRGALLERCGLEPASPRAETQLHALLGRRPEYLATRKEVSRLETLVGSAEASLADTPHILDAAHAESAQALKDGKAKAQEAADSQHQISSDIGALDRDVSEAESGRDLEVARTLVERKERAVAELLQSAHLNVAAEVLLDDIEKEHEVKRQPELLRRAQAWFSRFTHGAFALEFDPAGPADGRLRARDVAQGRLLTPAQLSTGTRAQLLLALRVSHAASAEGDGVKLPFFLDEALTTADSERFAEVAASLLELAEADGRQVIYLSARKEDARAWLAVAANVAATVDPTVAGTAAATVVANLADAEQVKVIDLAEVRSLEAAADAVQPPAPN